MTLTNIIRGLGEIVTSVPASAWIVLALLFAVCIAVAVVSHWILMKELEENLDELSGLVENQTALLQNLESLIRENFEDLTVQLANSQKQRTKPDDADARRAAERLRKDLELLRKEMSVSQPVDATNP